MRNETMYLTSECNTASVKGLPYFYCTRHASYVKRCHVCNRMFHTKRQHTTTCSNACRMALSRLSRSKV